MHIAFVLDRTRFLSRTKGGANDILMYCLICLGTHDFSSTRPLALSDLTWFILRCIQQPMYSRNMPRLQVVTGTRYQLPLLWLPH